MDAVYRIIHVTSEENYEKIMKDRYLRPYSSIHGTGIFCLIQKKKDDWKKIHNFRMFGNCAVELDKKIFLERNDYIIRKSVSLSPTWEVFGGPIIYSAKDDNDIKKLSSSLRKLTKLNEIRFGNKISLKKYMISNK